MVAYGKMATKVSFRSPVRIYMEAEEKSKFHALCKQTFAHNSCRIKTDKHSLNVKDGKLTHNSNAKCFRNVTLINIRDLAEIIVPFRGYGRYSPNQVMLERE